ncbi:MAG: IS3 family transposase, partial [Candidatus Obscuribacterales bacterium]|nr:IS3 family transposase [Candidatus Obscuribacterales bacterium]
KRLPVKRQCELLKISRSSLYYQPAIAPPGDLELMRLMDEQYLKTPFYGSRRMTEYLRRSGYSVGRTKVRRLMKLMGLEAIYQKPRTSIASPEHKKYPYLLGGLTIDRPGQVSAADITYIPMARGFLYLVGVIDWYSRFILSWRLSNTMEAAFCAEALKDSFVYGIPEVFNTDQGSQFTSDNFISVLEELPTAISMDGKGRWMDNIFIERFWRSLKYEEVYLRAYDSVAEARAGIARWVEFYNYERPHQSLDYRTPWEAFTNKPKSTAGVTFGVGGLKVKQNAIDVYNTDMIPYLTPEEEQDVINT